MDGPLDLSDFKKPAAKSETLTDDDIKVVSCVEQTFWETGSLPTNEAVAKRSRLPLESVKKSLKRGVVRQSLIMRGVDLTPEESTTLLSPEQLLLANLLLNSHDKRSVREKLKLLNISSQQYNAWLRQKPFKEYLRKRAESVFSASDHVAYNALVEAVEDGDLNAVKLYFEMRDIYNPKVQVDVNVHVVISKIVEIVTKHVQDAETLEAIADDIDRLQLN